MKDNAVAWVTGTNKGIGYEIAAGLGRLGWTVGVGARDKGRREAAVAKLGSAAADAFGAPLDVTDDASVTAAAGLIEEHTERLDVLVNTAGVTSGMPQTATTVDLRTVLVAVETNVFGVIRVANAMLPLLRRSALPRIVNMSSTVGSLALQSTPGAETSPIAVAYSPSKTFPKAVTVQYPKELHDTNILINAACPGYVATDLNGLRGLRPQNRERRSDPPRDAARRRPTSGFFDDAGVVAW